MASSSGSSAPKVGWGRWLTYLIGSIFAALLVPLMVGLGRPPDRRVARTPCSRRPPTRASRPTSTSPSSDLPVDDPVPPPHADPRAARVGDLDVRVVRRLRASPAAQRGRRRRRPARREHAITFDDQLRYLVAVQPRLAVPADPRRTSSTSSPSGCGGGSATRRRSRGLPARRDVFIAIAVAASLAPDPDGVVRAAGRRLGRRRGRARRPVAVGLAVPADRWQTRVARHRPSARRRGPARSGTTDDALAFTIQRDPNDNDRLLLARLRLRPDRPQRLERRTEVDEHPACRPTRRSSRTSPTMPVQPGHTSSPSRVTPERVPRRRRCSRRRRRPRSTRASACPTSATDGYFARARARRRARAVHGHGARPGRRATTPGELNEAALRAAGTDYPPRSRELYLQVADGAIGPNAQALEDKILAERRVDEPVSTSPRRSSEGAPGRARTTYTHRRPDARLRRPVDGRVLRPFKQGFCQYYATTMAILLRDLDIPARIVEGFLPGHARPRPASEHDPQQQRPRLGRGLLPGLRLGHVRPDRRRTCRPARAAAVRQRRSRAPAAPSSGSARPAPRSASATCRPGDPGGVGAAGEHGRAARRAAHRRRRAAARDRRRRSRSSPGGAARAAATTADGAYGTVTRIASRFGFGPRPDADRLRVRRRRWARSCPTSRPELETVARAKVEVAYGAPGPRRRPARRPAGRPAPAAGRPAAARLPAQGAPPPPLAPRSRRAARRRERRLGRLAGLPLGARAAASSSAARGGRSGCGRAGPAGRRGARRR